MARDGEISGFVRLNDGVARKIMQDPLLKQDLFERAQRIAAACGVGFVARRSTRYKKIARAAVITETYPAKKKNAAENTMVRNIEAGRG